MKSLILSLGACLLLTITQTFAKTNTGRQKELFDIWDSRPTSHKAASQDFILDETEGSGTDVVIDNTHGDDEDFAVTSGDGPDKDVLTNEPNISTSATVTEATTDKNVENVITDDEDLIAGSGSGQEDVEEEVTDVNSSLTGTTLMEVATTGTPKLLTPCENLRLRSLNLSQYVPECDADGAFNKRQCRTDKELYCWCVDPLGIEIPGTKLKEPQKPGCYFGENLSTCVFQLVQHSQGLIGSYRPNCTQDGHYEEIQCHDSNCWCVDQLGNEIYGTYKNRAESIKCPNAKTSTAATTKSTQVPMTKSPTSKAITMKTSSHVASTTLRFHHNIDVTLTNSGNEEDDIDVNIDEKTQDEDSNNETNKQNFHTSHEPTMHEPILAQPGLLAAIIGGTVVGLLCIVLLIMFIVYRMRKKDEGSYPLDEQRYQNYTYSRAPEKEFYA